MQKEQQTTWKKLFNHYIPFSPPSKFSKDGVQKSQNGYKKDDRSLLPKVILQKHGLLEREVKKNDSWRKKKKQEGCSYCLLIVFGQFSIVTKAVDIVHQ